MLSSLPGRLGEGKRAVTIPATSQRSWSRLPLRKVQEPEAVFIIRSLVSPQGFLSTVSILQLVECINCVVGDFFGPWHVACGISVPRPGIEPGPSAVRAQSPNRWTTGEFPVGDFLSADTLNRGCEIFFLSSVSSQPSTVIFLGAARCRSRRRASRQPCLTCAGGVGGVLLACPVSPAPGE